MFDVTWCGGLTEARKIANMADAYELPVAPHTAGGPLLFYASTHLTTALVQCVDPGELPALLRARLAGHAGESDRAARRIHPGSRGAGLRHEDQARGMEPPRRGQAGQRAVARFEAARSDFFGHDERLAILAPEHAVGLGVAADGVAGSVEMEGPADAVGDVRQVDQRSRDGAFLDRGVEILRLRVRTAAMKLAQLLPMSEPEGPGCESRPR